MKNKYDFEGSLDEFEIWLKNWEPNDLEKRVYSGETIVGGKKKMFWTEDGWKEGDIKKSEQKTSPFRVKKVDNKYEYDFVSYDEWDKIMTNEDENCEDDLLQGKFKHFKGCITTDE